MGRMLHASESTKQDLPCHSHCTAIMQPNVFLSVRCLTIVNDRISRSRACEEIVSRSEMIPHDFDRHGNKAGNSQDGLSG